MKCCLTILSIVVAMWSQFPPTGEFAAKSDQTEKKTVVIHSPRWCGACKTMRANYAYVGFELGDKELAIEWKESEHPNADGYPFVVSGDGKKFLQRRADGKQWTLNNLRVFAGLDAR